MAQTQPDLTTNLLPGEPRGLRAWILTDGKAGDEEQCRAVAEALDLSPILRRVAPRALFAWLMPWGPVDPGEAADRPESPIAPPWPDLAIASGRRAVPYLRAVKRGSGGRSFTAFLKDPRTGPGAADFVWAPEHDAVAGPNVLKTLTSPHRMSPARLVAARAAPDPRLAALERPRAAILVGGPARHVPFTVETERRFLEALAGLARSGVSLMITPSRRTPVSLRTELARFAAAEGAFCWDGAGDNPYPSMLALADAILVTADSVNMLSEAVATGAPVHLFGLQGGSARHRTFVAALERHGAVRAFRGMLEAFSYVPLDSTPVIAQALGDAFAAHRARLGSGGGNGPARRGDGAYPR
ncbi:MAG: nucleoside-diphosphate sugar epimerase [Enterovirga sp.]|nr:nucleoside-diphosphate sugar epimerase [Enterovirga sp.]